MASKSGLPRFTLAQYEEYRNKPSWQLDDENFKTKAEYDSHWVKTAKNWWRQYNEQYKIILAQWDEATQYIENIPAKSFDVFVPDVQIATERIPFALVAIMEQIAMLYSTYPQPAVISPSEEQDQYVAALNQFIQIELRANSFNCLMLDAGVDVGYANLAVLKPYIDHDQIGAYGQQGRIVIEKLEPSKIAYDPTAKRLRWENLGFIIYKDQFDLGTARKLYAGGRSQIEEFFEEATSGNQDIDEQYGTNLKSPVPNPVEGNSTLRNKVEIAEVWFKDNREKFVADIESVDNRQFVEDPDKPGEKIANTDYDSDHPEVYTRPRLDENGFVIGRMVPAYPGGRCIVIAGDKVVIEDFPNPYGHKKAPFVFIRGRPGKRLVAVGDLGMIIRIDKKLNDIYGRIHVMAQNEIERPMVANTNTFKTPRAWMRMSGQATSVIVKQTGSEFGRLPFMEIPQFVFLYLQKLESALERVMAVAGIMRGQLTEGSQLSAESVSSLQGMATQVLKMKAELIAEGMRDLGYQLTWLIRDNYPENITVKITKPDMTQIAVDWNEEDAADDYVIDIESGSGLPGQTDPGINTVLPLFREGLIDRPAALQMLRKFVPNWQQIASRMQQDKLQKIEAEAAGRAEGVRIKQFEKERETAGGDSKS